MSQPAWTETVVVPAELQASDLGAARKVWKARHSAVGGAMVPLGAGALGIAAGLVLAVLGSPIALGVVPIGAMFLIIGLILLRSARPSASAIAEYESGFAARVGRRTITGPWSAVASITSDEVFRARTRGANVTMVSYEIRMQNGDSFVLDVWITEVYEIIKIFKAAVASVLLPPMQADYDAGKDVTFGDVRVSRDAITVRERRLAWSEVANASVKHGQLVITPNDGTKPVEERVSRIPNIEQLCELIGVKPPLDLRRFA